jgi:hypothetical protein
MERKRYTGEFKREAVKLARQRGLREGTRPACSTASSACRQLLGLDSLSMKPCVACLDGPRGVAGHPALRIDTLRQFAAAPALQTFFVCDACAATWQRLCVDGRFEWRHLTLPPAAEAR